MVEGRLLCFPNFYQHQVQPFRLADPTKPGHRKIIAFFLVDPSIHILSSKNVVPQNVDWWRMELDASTSIPSLVTANVLEFTDCPYSLEEARRLREELMDERSTFVGKHNEEYFEREFSLCEH